MKICWVTDGNEFRLLLNEEPEHIVENIGINDSPSPDIDILIINANPGYNQRSKRLGLVFLQKARRDFKIKTPIIVYSFEAYEKLVSEFTVLNTKGVSFLQLPFTSQEISNHISNTDLTYLTENEFLEVVRDHCGVREEWKKAIHDLNYGILKYPSEYEKVRDIINNISTTIEIFASAHNENLKTLQQLLALEPFTIDLKLLFNAYKKLKVGLELSPRIDSEKNQLKSESGETEKKPPKFYSKILLANDEPNLPLANFLRTNYGYNVLKQATNLTEAKRAFLSEQPEVVIADYYFKTPEEGMKFIEFVADKKHKWQPLVLVNSFRDLSQVRFPDGVINCSGDEAQNPEFIHAQIWKTVREDVENPETEDRADLPEGVSAAEDDCRRFLTESIIPGLQFGINRWRKFPADAVTYSLNLLRTVACDETSDAERILINRMIEVLEPYESDKDFSYAAVKNLVGMIRSLHQETDGLTISDVSNVLHLIGHTFLSYSLTEVDYSLESLAKVIVWLDGLPKYEKASDKIKILLEKTQNEVFYLRDGENLLKGANNIVKLLPELNLEVEESRNQSKKQIRIAVVEDDRLYREDFVIPVIEDVKFALKEKGYEIKVEPYENTDDALNSVPMLDKTRRINLKESDSSRTLAVVDLYLPKIADGAAQLGDDANKQKKLTTPEKQNGLDLIKALRSPNRNIPVIVFSTSGDDRDRRDIQRLGVAQKNHINKRGANVRKTLFDALVRNITKDSEFYIEEVDEGGKTVFRVNDVFIELDNAETRILKAIFKLSMEKPRFTASDILNLLNKRVAEDSVKKSISSIRKKIQNTLALNAMTVGTEDIISTVPSTEGRKSAYRLAADIKTADYDEKKKKSFNVLIIENDSQTLSYIASSLETIKKIKIERATNVEEAVEKAKTFRPDIISLDLDIPRTREAFAKNPGSGDRNAGLDALDEIKLDFSNVKVILTSTFFNDRILRDRAAQLGISNENIVPKFESSGWINLLIQKVKQLGEEVMLGKKADILPDVPEPRIEILEGCDIDAGVLKLKVNDNLYAPRKSQQAAIIGLLLKEANKILTYEKIKKQLNLTKITDNNRKTWASRIREDIRNLWLRLPESEFIGAEDRILENLPEKGMTLRVHILNPDKLK